MSNLHTVSRGDVIKSDDINQFVPLYQEHPTDNVFGTPRGVLIQNGNSIDVSRFGDAKFGDVFEVVGTKGSNVALWLGKNIDQAKSLLGVDRLFTFDGNTVTELSSKDWYGGLSVSNEQINKSIGFAKTSLSTFEDYISRIVVDGRQDDETQTAVVWTNNLSAVDVSLSARLEEIGFEDCNIRSRQKIATRSQGAIQQIYKFLETQEQPIKQFDLRGIVETRKISVDNQEKTQYKWKVQWYSHYDALETRAWHNKQFAVSFNDKELRFRGEHRYDTPEEGWNTLSASEDWEDEISCTLKAYLNVSIDIMDFKRQTPEQYPDWEYNEDRTYYDISDKPLSVTFWCLPGSLIPGSYDEQTEDWDYSDGFYCVNSYKIGEVKFNNENVKVEQVFDGTQTFIAPIFHEGYDISSDEPYEVPDSEISDVRLSSLERESITISSQVSSVISGAVHVETISTDYDCWRFYDFKDPVIRDFKNVTLRKDDDGQGITRQFVIREHDDENNTSIVRYAEISSIEISGDTEMSAIGLSSVTRKSYDDTKDYFQLYNFDSPDTDLDINIDNENKKIQDNLKILVRDSETGTLRYSTLCVDISSDCSVHISALCSEVSTIKNNISSMSADIISISADMKTDSEIPVIELSSVQRYIYQDEIGKNRKAYMLYNFHNPDTDLEINFTKDDNKTPDELKILVRDNETKKLRYADMTVNLSDAYNNISSISSDISTINNNISSLSNHISSIYNNISSLSDDIKYLSSQISSMSADMKTDSEVPLIELSSVQRYAYQDETGQDRKAYMLYNFHNPDSLLWINYNFLSTEQPGQFKFLVRDDDTGTLRYSNLDIDLNYISGDVDIDWLNQYSVEVRNDTQDECKFIQLYKFEDDEGHTLELEVPDYEEYFDNGGQVIKSKWSSDETMDLIVRNKINGQNAVDYRKLSVSIPPFIHGDSDPFVGTGRYSIQSVIDYNEPNKTYYQLYEFDNPGSDYQKNELDGEEYINLANGAEEGETGDVNDMFLVRDSNGCLTYKKIYVKGDGNGWDEGRIQDIENNITNIEGDITNIDNSVNILCGDIQTVISGLSELSDKVWIQGEDYTTNYGSSIGDSTKTEAIDLDAHTLDGAWLVDDSFGVGGTLTCASDFIPYGNTYFGGTIAGNDGSDITCDSDLDMNNKSIKNLGSLQDTNGNTVIDLDNNQLVGDWETTGKHTVDGDIECLGSAVVQGDIGTNCLLVDSLTTFTDGNTEITVQTDMTFEGSNSAKNLANVEITSGGKLKIGNTTLNETQLQQLLALLNSSNNVMNQQY